MNGNAMRPVVLCLLTVAICAAELEGTPLGNWGVVYWYDDIMEVDTDMSRKIKRVAMMKDLELIRLGRREYIRGTIPAVRGIENRLQEASIFIEHERVFSMVLARDGQRWAEFFKSGEDIRFWKTVPDEATAERYDSE